MSQAEQERLSRSGAPDDAAPLRLDRMFGRGIRNIAGAAFRFYLKNPKGCLFMLRTGRSLRREARVRAAWERAGTHIPPFLIASVASSCNLHCAGCYARANGGCGESAQPAQLGTDDWDRIFGQAAELGISFVLLAGGEPLLRRDLMETAAAHRDLFFPVFTNGTLLDGAYLHLFDRRRNLIPVLSLEGDAAMTDARRGPGVFAGIEAGMKSLHDAGILYGASITVTSQNMELVTSSGYVAELGAKGCGLLFLVEYVPAQAGSQHLVLSEGARLRQRERVQALKAERKSMSILAFPGDEGDMGGCLAAGRGFFHINASGGAEPCPFSPFSDTNLKTHTLRQALASPLFRALRDEELLNLPHAGGCALFDQRETVAELLARR